MKKALLVFVCILGLFSCATYRLDPLPSQDITIRNERGKQIPLYSDEKIGMVIIPEFVESELMLKVHVLNKTDNQISIKDTDFIIEESLDRINWKELYVYDSHEYYKKEKAQYIAGAILMVLGAAADSASAGYGTASTSGTVYGSSSYGSYSGSYYGTTTYYDPAAAQIASQRNAQMVENYAASGRSWLQMLEENLFYSVDLNPGQEYFGIIFSKKGSSVYYRVRSKNDNIRLLSIEYLKVQN